MWFVCLYFNKWFSSWKTIDNPQRAEGLRVWTATSRRDWVRYVPHSKHITLLCLPRLKSVDSLISLPAQKERVPKEALGLTSSKFLGRSKLQTFYSPLSKHVPGTHHMNFTGTLLTFWQPAALWSPFTVCCYSHATNGNWLERWTVNIISVTKIYLTYPGPRPHKREWIQEWLNLPTNVHYFQH